MNNALILIQLLLQLTTQAQAISQLLAKAHSEGRDVTEEEIDILVQGDDAAKAALAAAIEAAKASGN